VLSAGAGTVVAAAGCVLPLSSPLALPSSATQTNKPTSSLPPSLHRPTHAMGPADDDSWSFELIPDCPAGTNAVSWAPAGHVGAEPAEGGQPTARIATAGCDGKVRVYRKGASAPSPAAGVQGAQQQQQQGGWSLEATLPGHGCEWVRDVAWSPASGAGSGANTIASCCDDGRVVVWRSGEGGAWSASQLPAFPAPVWRVSWNAGGSLLAVSCGDNSVTVWREAAEVGGGAPVWQQVSVLPDPAAPAPSAPFFPAAPSLLPPQSAPAPQAALLPGMEHHHAAAGTPAAGAAAAGGHYGGTLPPPQQQQHHGHPPQVYGAAAAGPAAGGMSGAGYPLHHHGAGGQLGSAGPAAHMPSHQPPQAAAAHMYGGPSAAASAAGGAWGVGHPAPAAPAPSGYGYAAPAAGHYGGMAAAGPGPAHRPMAAAPHMHTGAPTAGYPAAAPPAAAGRAPLGGPAPAYGAYGRPGGGYPGY
jgi:hypothetical protein